MNNFDLRKYLAEGRLKVNEGDMDHLMQDLERELKQHDWFYYMADDPRSYDKGTNEQRELKKLLKMLNNSPEAIALYNKYAPVQDGIDLRIKTVAEEKRPDYPDVDEVGKFFIVEKPTKDSEMEDVVYELSLPEFALQVKGGLDIKNILGVYKQKSDARRAGTEAMEAFRGAAIEKSMETNESYGSSNDFGGMGLIVKGRTSKDNDLIDQAVEESGFYGVYNSQEDYWFFPEEGDQSTIDRLENKLETIFMKKGADVSYEAQFNENINEEKMTEGTRSTGTYTQIKRFLSDLSMLKDKYYSIVGSDDVFDGLDRAQMAAEELMRNAPENRGELAEDLDLGHEDDEPGMLKGDLYKIGKYSMELYQMMDDLEDIDGEVDLPHWWQSKVTTAKNMISGAKHYLEFELKEPAIDDMVTEDSLDDEAKVYFMQKVKRGEIDKLPEDPKAAFVAQMTKDQMDHDKETSHREGELEEIGMFNDPVGYEKSQPNPRDKVFTKKYVSSGIYDIFKNGKKVKTINGEGEANAWMNAEMRKLKEDAFYTRDVKDAVVSKLMDQLRK